MGRRVAGLGQPGLAREVVVVITVPLHVEGRRWRLDPELLASAITSRTRALLLMSPSMPSGHVSNDDEWRAIAELCVRHDLWLLYDTAMERLLFDGLAVRHPAGLPGMAERTVTLGSVSKEFRMIGWRIGWAVGPAELSDRIVWTHTYNVVTPPGLTQSGAEAALRAGDGAGVAESAAELQRRRDEVTHQLSHLPLVVPEGGWSMLLDADAMGTTPAALSEKLLLHGKVAATPMHGWGERVAPRYLRLVFAREPVSRLAELRHRFAAAGF
jgi:aspartate/methionine/tyrosine aminotransferase